MEKQATAAPSTFNLLSTFEAEHLDKGFTKKSYYSDFAADDYFGRTAYIYLKYVVDADSFYDIVDYAETLDDVYTFMGVDPHDQPFLFYDMAVRRRLIVFNPTTLKYLFCKEDYNEILPYIEEVLQLKKFTEYHKTPNGHLLVHSNHFRRFLAAIGDIIGYRFQIAFFVQDHMKLVRQLFRQRFARHNGKICQRPVDTEDELLWAASSDSDYEEII